MMNTNLECMSETLSKQIVVRVPSNFYKEVADLAKKKESGVATTFRELARIGFMVVSRYEINKKDPLMSDDDDPENVSLDVGLEDLFRFGKMAGISDVISNAMDQHMADMKILIAEMRAERMAENAKLKEQIAAMKAEEVATQNQS